MTSEKTCTDAPDICHWVSSYARNAAGQWVKNGSCMGGGVTSFEAFGVCTPVVVLPAETSVLQLTLGQYRAMGIYDLIAHDVASFARLAVSVANGLQDWFRRRICARKHLLFDQRLAVREWATWIGTVGAASVATEEAVAADRGCCSTPPPSSRRRAACRWRRDWRRRWR